MLSLNDELPDDLLWGSDNSGAGSNGLSNGSLDGLGSSSNISSSSISSQPQPGPGMMTQSTMNPSIRPPGPMGAPMNQMQAGSMAGPNQNTTLVNALAGKVPGQMANVRVPTPSSTPNNSISDGSMTSMGGPMNQQGELPVLKNI